MAKLISNISNIDSYLKQNTHISKNANTMFKVYFVGNEMNPTNKPRGRNVVLFKVLFEVKANGTTNYHCFYKGVNLL